MRREDQYREILSSQISAAQNKLYWQMIADGRLPSEGWRFADELVLEGTVYRYRCWAVPPAGMIAGG